MTITPTTLSRAAGLAAVAAGLLFISVQINHPHMVVSSVSTTEWVIRNSMKVLMAALALAGITGMYLRQVRQTGVLGLLGYLLFSAGYLVILSIAFVGAYVLPTVAETAPGYVSDFLAFASEGTTQGDIGPMQTAVQVSGFTYLAGGLVFGIALYRAGVLARWAALLLAFASVATLAMPLLPHMADRVLAYPNSIAMIGLGLSLWRSTHISAPQPITSPAVTTASAE
ncbi:hypothetical protein FB561_2251 [Kribbella amoyensis]|uniref:DUF4386 family protein n=1 Tax=Kribbella amoyensis TaxID=996641 RepID=A0A561BQJ5_9ACTN|nr:hypothetical protein [Kribbella amoyensis]TWD81147.1 hypothetical protein FB561_2251 [Kribbella amoyensis]